MPCYHPRIMYESLHPTSSGKTKYVFLKNDNLPAHSFVESLEPITKDKFITVPCKKCVGCRLDFSRRWADRLMLEFDHTGKAIFVTLTYDDDHLTFGDSVSWFDVDPSTGEAFEFKKQFPTLVKRDVQLFNKRLREYFSGTEIRFYLAGEYGSKTLRPHYHAIYFGLDISDLEEVSLLQFNTHSQPIYKCDLLSRLWSKGFVSVGRVSWQSCAYVARYSLKKLGSKENLCASRGVIDEFSLMSRRPGISGHFVDDHPECLENPRDKIFLSDEFGVKPHSSVNLPSFLFDKLEDINPELYNEIKEARKASLNERFWKELSNTDLDEISYLNLKEFNHEKGLRALVRDL